VAPGRYLAGGGTACQWQRLSPQGQELGAWSGTGQTVVDITTPETISTQGCGTFAPAPTQASPRTSIPDGTWIVGAQLAPGRWQTNGGAQCTWARLADFKGSPQSVLAQGAAASQTIVEVQPTDVGLTVQGGCTWAPAA